jgi:DNA repair exonuclease SbcCD ATPase subunit
MINDFIFIPQTGKESYPYKQNIKQKMSNLTLNEELFDAQFELREERRKRKSEYEQYQSEIQELQRKIEAIEAAALESVLRIQNAIEEKNEIIEKQNEIIQRNQDIIKEKDDIIRYAVNQYEHKMQFYSSFFGQSFNYANEFYYYTNISPSQVINDFTDEMYIFQEDVNNVISQLDNGEINFDAGNDSGYNTFDEYDILVNEINETIEHDEESDSDYSDNLINEINEPIEIIYEIESGYFSETDTIDSF